MKEANSSGLPEKKTSVRIPVHSPFIPAELTSYAVDQTYYLKKASFVVRLIQYLQYMQANRGYRVDFFTLINQFDGWIIRIKLNSSWPLTARQYLQEFALEMGRIYCELTSSVQASFLALENGESTTDVMNQYHVAVVDHGKPNIEELEVFRHYVIEGLGYCPETLA